MKSIYGSALFFAALLAGNLLHAQLTNVDLSAIEDTTPSSPDELPVIGNYYSAANPTFGPAPGNIFGLWGWSLGGENYLLDDLPGAPSGGTFAMDDSGGFSPDDEGGGGGGFTNDFSFPTNGLWLWINGTSNNTVYANLNNATDYVYEIYSSTNLATSAQAVSNWDVENIVFPGTNIAVSPFIVPMNGRNPLFLWARDWTGITSNGNTTPDWWFWEYFGTIDLSDTSLDSVGQELEVDYQYGADPNIIGFGLLFPSVVHTSLAEGTVTNISGTPFYFATLVNDTNMADANWQPYTGTNVAVSLGASNGIYSVSVGLKGFPANAMQVWVPAQIVLETFTPTFTVITPTNSTVSQPMIQLQGLFNEILSNLTYDVSNALGVITNQQGYWNPAFFDTNVVDFTTNAFQCYDISLTNGLNTITLHAMDRLGNIATTNVSFTLDYSNNTNPPALSILWPSNGMAIAGNSFTLQAQVNDDTATVTAQITDSNGDTNTVSGLVERDGVVLVNNLPLAAGINILTVTATNTAGNSMTTNLTLVQSTVMVTMDPLTQFNQASVTVTGTVSDTNETVYVNSVQATVHGDGTWTACMVPVSPAGTAVFDIEIYRGDPIWDGSQIILQAQLPFVTLMSYVSHLYSSTIQYPVTCDQTFKGTEVVNWDFQSGGSDIGTGSDPNPCGGGPPTGYSANNLSGGYGGYSTTWQINSSSGNTVSMPFWTYNSGNGIWAYYNLAIIISQQSDANARVGIAGSDQATVGQKALFLVSAQVTSEDTGQQLPGSSLQFNNQLHGTSVIDVTNGDGSVWSQFLAYGIAGTTNPLDVTPIGQNISYNSPSWQVTNVTLQIVANGTTLDPIMTNAEFCVGQQLTLSNSFNPSVVTNLISSLIMSTDAKWVFTGDYVNANSGGSSSSSTNYFVDSDLLTNAATQAWWVSGGTNPPITYSATLAENLSLNNGKQIIVAGKGLFNMYKPQAKIIASTTSVNIVDEITYSELAFYDPPSPGITFSNTIFIKPGFSGTVGWIQVVSDPLTQLQDTNSVWHVTTENGPSPYGDYPIPYNAIVNGNPYDEPSLGLPSDLTYIRASASGNFTMWMMFQPSSAESISVPLKAVNWYWSGSATNNAGTWELLTGTNSVNPADFDTQTFPEWNSNVTNLTYIPPLL